MAKRPTPYNETLTTKDTEYKINLPMGTEKIMIQARTANVIRIAFVTGKVATPTNPYYTIKAGSTYYDNDIDLQGSLYLASDTDGVIAEILVWVR